MPTPASGQISLSDVALIVYNSTSAQISLYENEVILLSAVSTSTATQLTGVTYTQSSVYSSNNPATYAYMNDNNADGATNNSQTGTNSELNAFVKADCGSTKYIEKVVIGYDYNNNLPGGWGVSYTEGRLIQVSTDNTNWTTVNTAPTYATSGSTNGLVSLNVKTNARYVRVVNPGTTDFMCLLEFQVWESQSLTPQVALSNLYNKPTAGNSGSTYNTPGSYSWIVVPYKTLTANVVAAGGAGGGYYGGQILPFAPYPCGNFCNGTDGTNGGNTDFNGVFAYGGDGGRCCGGTPTVGASRGNNINANTGGGGAGGAGNTNPADTNCNQSSGRNGGAGGFAVKSWTKGVDGPGYGSTINFTVGAGGTSTGGCRGQAGGPGGNGSVYLSWS